MVRALTSEAKGQSNSIALFDAGYGINERDVAHHESINRCPPKAPAASILLPTQRIHCQRLRRSKEPTSRQEQLHPHY